MNKTMDQHAVAHATQDVVLNLVQRWAEAEHKGDADALNRLLDQDFRLVGPLGFVLAKPDALERFRNGLKYTAIDVQDTLVRMFGGDTAVVIAALSQQASYNGNDSSGKFRITLVIVQHGERWAIASLHYSPMADMPPGGPPQNAGRFQ